jgi:hypothetical protein
VYVVADLIAVRNTVDKKGKDIFVWKIIGLYFANEW